MEQVTASPVREQLVGRRQRLEQEIGRVGDRANLARLIQEVDDALRRLDTGTYGLCETCRDTIEADRLLADPLARFCLDHLPPAEQRALERDLMLAASIQRALLPAPSVEFDGWQVAYHYRPSRIVSGDYCDHIGTGAGDFYFMVGDVSGKGVAASMLMSHLQAMFRALVPTGLPLDALVARASHAFCESTLPSHFATLVCGRATPSGDVEICNAGHPPALVIRPGAIDSVAATGLPLGMFCAEQYSVSRVRLDPGDTLLLCTDGVLEAENPASVPYGSERLLSIAARIRDLPASAFVEACVRDLDAFIVGAPYGDDVTIMALRRR